jgi:hypothetical protein
METQPFEDAIKGTREDVARFNAELVRFSVH